MQLALRRLPRPAWPRPPRRTACKVCFASAYVRLAWPRPPRRAACVSRCSAALLDGPARAGKFCLPWQPQGLYKYRQRPGVLPYIFFFYTATRRLRLHGRAAGTLLASLVRTCPHWGSFVTPGWPRVRPTTSWRTRSSGHSWRASNLYTWCTASFISRSRSGHRMVAAFAGARGRPPICGHQLDPLTSTPSCEGSFSCLVVFSWFQQGAALLPALPPPSLQAPTCGASAPVHSAYAGVGFSIAEQALLERAAATARSGPLHILAWCVAD